MPVNLTSKAILFTIHSAIRLGRSVQRAYVNSIKGKQIVLPLPAFNAKPTLLSASRFFEDTEGGNPFLSEITQLADLHKAQQSRSLTPDEEATYLEYYSVLFRALRNEVESTGVEEATLQLPDILNLLKIRQWELGHEPEPSALQLVAGTIVEIGVDYFNQVPGALNPNSLKGKALQSVLSGFDKIRFSESDNLKKTIGQEVVPALFIGATETLQELGPIISADPKVQNFIQQSAESITGDLIERLKSQEDSSLRSHQTRWGQLVFNSLIRHAGTFIVNSPAEVLNSNERVYRVIEASGQAILNILIDPNSDAINFRELLSTESLDEIIRSTLKMVAEYPALWTNQEGLQALVKDLSEGLVASGIQIPGLLPHLVQLILTSTADNLEELWVEEESSANFLLVKASKELLLAFGKTRADGKWPPGFTQNQLLYIAERLLQHLIAHPSILMKDLEEESVFHFLVDISLDTLAKLPEGERIRKESLIDVVESSLYAGITHSRLLQKINLAADEDEQYLFKHLLDIILNKVNSEEELELNERLGLLQDLLEFALEKVINHHPGIKGLVAIRLLLNPENGINFREGLPELELDILLKAGLQLLELYPETMLAEGPVQKIISEVAAALRTSGTQQPALLLEISRLTIEKVAKHSTTLVPEVEGLEALLLETLSQTLLVLIQKEENTVWQPNLNLGQLLLLLDRLYEEVIQTPHLILEKLPDDSLLALVIEDLLRALVKLPPLYRLSSNHFQDLLLQVLRVVSTKKDLLQLYQWADESEEKSLLELVTANVIGLLFEKATAAPYDHSFKIQAWLGFFLDTLEPNYDSLLIMDFLAGSSVPIDLADEDAESEIVSIIDTLQELLERYPILSGEEGKLGILLTSLSQAVEPIAKYPALSLEVMQMVFSESMDRLEWYLEVSEDEQNLTHLLIEIVQQISEAITDDAYGELWLERFTPGQTSSIYQLILDRVYEQPEWAQEAQLKKLLHAIFIAIKMQAKNRQIPFQVIIQTIEVLSRSLENPAEWIQAIEVEAESKLFPVTYMLEWIWQMIFTRDHATRVHLLKEDVFPVLLEYSIDLNQRRSITTATIDDTALRLNEKINEFASGKLTLSTLKENLS